MSKIPDGQIQAGGGQRRLRVLLVEDSEADALLLGRALKRGGFAVICHRVDCQEALEKALEEEWDLVLADHSMPQFSATEALAMVQKRGIDLPFIIVSGQIEEETAVAAMQSGAHDYIMKDRLARLVPAVERELREAEVRRARKHSEEALQLAHAQLELRVEQRTADLRAANRRLREVLEERRRLEQELLEIAENERRRIGFDLHDDLGQKLTGASMMMKGLEHKLGSQGHPSAADAQRIQQLIEDIIHHMHNLAKQFSSLDAKGDDLGTVLRSLVSHVESMFNIRCQLEIEGQVPELPQETIVQLYKISQEAVSNGIKHGKATRVDIRLSACDGRIVLSIRNDGKPFSEPPGAKHRMGLRIMNYRANTIGATFGITGVENLGTVVTCELCAQNEGAIRHFNGAMVNAADPCDEFATPQKK